MNTHVPLTRRAALRAGSATRTALAVHGMAGAPTSSASPARGADRASAPAPMRVVAGRARRSQPHVGLL